MSGATPGPDKALVKGNMPPLTMAEQGLLVAPELLIERRITALQEKMGGGYDDFGHRGTVKVRADGEAFVYFSKDGRITVGEFERGSAQVATSKEMKLGGPGTCLWDAEINREGTRLVAGIAHHGLVVFDLSKVDGNGTPTIILERQASRGVFYTVATNEAGTVFTGATGNGELKIIRTGQPHASPQERTMNFHGHPSDLALSPAGDRLAIAMMRDDDGHDWNATKKWAQIEVVALDGVPGGQKPKFLSAPDGSTPTLLGSKMTPSVDYYSGDGYVKFPANAFDAKANTLSFKVGYSGFDTLSLSE